jgi:hypothetical protein
MKSSCFAFGTAGKLVNERKCDMLPIVVAIQSFPYRHLNAGYGRSLKSI